MPEFTPDPGLLDAVVGAPSDVLGRQVAAGDDCFAPGGTSLQAAIVNRLQRAGAGPFAAAHLFGEHRGIDPTFAERWRQHADAIDLSAGTLRLAEEIGYPTADADAEQEVWAF